MPDTAQFILTRLTEWGIQRVYGSAIRATASTV